MKLKILAVLTPILAAVLCMGAPAAAVRAEELTLKGCLEKALADNPQIAEAELGRQAGEAGIDSARGNQWPRLAAELNYTRRQDPVPFIPAQSITIPAHFSDEFAAWTGVLTLPLYQGGRIAAGITLARVRRDLAGLALSQTRNDLIANTINIYNKLLQLQQLTLASRASVTALEEQQKNAGLLLDLGRMAKVDLLKVTVQLANERQRLLSLEEAVATTGATLRSLMGVNPAAGHGPDSGSLILQPPPADGMALPEAAWDFGDKQPYTNRPEYRTALKAAEEAGINRAIAYGKLLPSVGVAGGYMDQYGADPWYSEANWFFGLQLSMPLFDRPLHADLAKERILQEKAAAHLRTVENQLRLEVETARASLRESGGRVEAAERAIEQAHESFRIEQQKYSTGAGVMSDLLLAQAADMTAAANLSQARFDHAAAWVAWRRATGTLEDYLQ